MQKNVFILLCILAIWFLLNNKKPKTIDYLQNGTTNVNIIGYEYSPKILEVSKNTTVTWKNTDDMMHTVTENNKIFDSKNIDPGESFEYTFKKVGVYKYYCIPHPWMKGTVIVK